MATYSASDIVGKTLATTNSSVRAFNRPGGPSVASIPKNSTIGKVYSWIQRPEGIYWMFETTKPTGSVGSVFYVLHQKGLKVLDRDVRSEQQKEFDELSWFKKLVTPSPEQQERREELGQNVKKGLIMAGLAVAAFFLVKDLGKEYISKKVKAV